MFFQGHSLTFQENIEWENNKIHEVERLTIFSNSLARGDHVPCWKNAHCFAEECECGL